MLSTSAEIYPLSRDNLYSRWNIPKPFPNEMRLSDGAFQLRFVFAKTLNLDLRSLFLRRAWAFCVAADLVISLSMGRSHIDREESRADVSGPISTDP